MIGQNKQELILKVVSIVKCILGGKKSVDKQM